MTRRGTQGAVVALCVLLGGCCDPETLEAEPTLVEPLEGTWLVSNPGLVVYQDAAPKKECAGVPTAQQPEQEWYKILFRDSIEITNSVVDDGLIVVFTLHGFAGEFSDPKTECHASTGGEFTCFNRVFVDGPLSSAAMAIGYSGYFADARNGTLNVDLSFIDDNDDVLCSMWTLLGIAHDDSS